MGEHATQCAPPAFRGDFPAVTGPPRSGERGLDPLGHPAVLNAAVVAIAHPKWQERPLLIVMRKAGAQVTAAELMAFLSDKVAKWWLPDAIEFVEQLPMTATGKVHKLTLRGVYKDYKVAVG